MQKAMISIISILLSSFVFTLAYYYKPAVLKSYFRKNRDRLPKGKAGFLKTGSKGIKILINKYMDFRIFNISIRDEESFFVFRVLLSSSVFCLTLVFGFLLNKNFLLVSSALGISSFFLPYLVALRRIRKITQLVLEELPEIIDLLSALISSGLTINEALYYIAKNYRGHISLLFRHARHKVLEGDSLEKALSEIADMSFCKEFKRFIDAMLQAERVGNPIKRVLNNMSKTVRDDQRDHIKTRAERLEGNLMVIIFIFLFIPMLSIFLLPVIPQIRLLF